MKYKNSFFKIRIKEDGTYLDVFPPKEDGKRLDIREVVSFLEQKGFAGFSIDAVSYTHLRAHETDSYLVCRLLLEKKKKN